MADWAEVTLAVPRPQLARVSAAMMDLGAVGLQEDHLPGTAPPPRQPWDTGPLPTPSAEALLRGWWSGQDFVALWPQLQPALERLTGTVASWLPVKDQDWADSWRDLFDRVIVSPDVVVAPPWKAQPGDLVIDPGMAFGTGEYPTTRACLAATGQLGVAGGTCLDVGTGTGVVALLAARLGMTARGIDIDPEAIDAAGDNARANGLQVQLDTTPLQAVTGHFDLVVANIFAEVLVVMAPDLARLTRHHLVLAGILADRAHLVVDALIQQGMTIETRTEEGDWVSMVWAAATP